MAHSVNRPLLKEKTWVHQNLVLESFENIWPPRTHIRVIPQHSNEQNGSKMKYNSEHIKLCPHLSTAKC